MVNDLYSHGSLFKTIAIYKLLLIIYHNVFKEVATVSAHHVLLGFLMLSCCFWHNL